MAALVHDLRVGIDGDEIVVKGIEEEFRRLFVELSRLGGGGLDAYDLVPVSGPV